MKIQNKLVNMSPELAGFSFGANWLEFSKIMNEKRINEALLSLKKMLGCDTLVGKSFLDIGCGSGLFSLAARKLGARVYSFDSDGQSVQCTSQLKNYFFKNDDNWIVVKGSVLDRSFIASLGTFDIVYSWGVLHHTGSMWNALEYVIPLVSKNGKLFIAIYNDQGQSSLFWLKIKMLYNKLPKYLPQGTIVAHKTGEIGYSSHDGGIVFSPKADYIIVVFSKSDIPAAAEERIAQISKNVYEYFNN